MTPARKIVWSSLGALLLAAALLVSVVLPAEYGWDPLGSGAALGLVGMSEANAQPLLAGRAQWREDSIEFQLLPFESVEYKYHLSAGEVLLYQWRANGEVLFDMHSEPAGAAPGYAETFYKSEASSDGGSYQAPFSGIHGWYWQNRSQKNVTIALHSVGYFDYSLQMNESGVRRFEFAAQP